jgi:hypothetical protein
LAITAEQHGKIIKPRNNALKLYAFDKKHRDWSFVFAECVEEYILKVIRFLGHYSPLLVLADHRPLLRRYAASCVAGYQTTRKAYQQK